MNPFEKTFSKKEESFTVSPILLEAAEKALENIAERKALIRPYNATQERFSKRLVLGRQNNIIPLICEETGAVMGLLNPAIPGKSLVYRSPLASVAVCKDIASEGFSYLSLLDTSILAAILITLAAEHSLFHYGVSISGAQKNALIRTAPREFLIEAIVILVGKINSINARFIPSLSLILEKDVDNESIRIRMFNWLSAVRDVVGRPLKALKEEAEEKEEQEQKKPIKLITAITVTKHKKNVAEQAKEFKKWKREAKNDIDTMFKDKKISLKLKTFLLATIVESEILASTDSTLVELMATKLEQLNILAASHIAIGLRKYYRIYSEATKEEDITTSFASTPVGVYEQKEESSNEIDIGSPDDVKEAEGIKQAPTALTAPTAPISTAPTSIPSTSIAPIPTIPTPPTSTEKTSTEAPVLSFMQRLRMKRTAEEAAIQQAHNAILNPMPQEKQENDDAPF